MDVRLRINRLDGSLHHVIEMGGNRKSGKRPFNIHTVLRRIRLEVNPMTEPKPTQIVRWVPFQTLHGALK